MSSNSEDKENNDENKCQKCQLLEEENKKLREENKTFKENNLNSKSLTLNIETLEKIKEKNEEKIKSQEDEIKKLNEEKSNLREQVLKYQLALGSATTFRFDDNDKNNPVQLNDDILRLQDNLAKYVTNLRPKTDININFKNINSLLNKYKIKKNKSTFTNTNISNDTTNNYMNDIFLVKAVLQRHVLQTILDYYSEYCRKFGKDSDYRALEARFSNKAVELEELAEKLGKERNGNDIVTSAVSVKIRQQSFVALGNRGFSDIILKDQDKQYFPHNFIEESRKKLNTEMESYRKILDSKKEKDVEEMAGDIIREVIRLFSFRLKTQEPIAEWEWLDDDEEFDPTRMTTGSQDNEEDIKNPVEICTFPLIYRRSDSNNGKSQYYIKATVFIRDNYNLFRLVDKNSINLFKIDFFKNSFKK